MVRRLKPVRVHELHPDPAAFPKVSGGGGQVDVVGQNARRSDHKFIAATEAQFFDQSQVRLDPRDPAAEVGQHPGMGVDANELDAGAVQRRREPAHADPQIKDGAPGRAAPVEPGPEVLGFGKRGVELGEARVRVVRVVPDSD
jgi:hypothetical protein